MNRRWLVGVCIALLLGVGSAHAKRWVIPSGGRTVGAHGTDWRTDLRLLNPTGYDLEVKVHLLPTRQDNSGLPEFKFYTVTAGAQLVVGNIFNEFRNEEISGALQITCSDARLVVSSRTYNIAMSGDGPTYGQYYPAVPIGQSLTEGVEGHIIYLAKSESHRTNLGYVATTDRAGRVTVELYDAVGDLIGSKSRDSLPFEHRQFNDIFDVTGAPATTAARAVVKTTQPAIFYASIIDAVTGDPVTVMAKRTVDASTEQALAGTARAPGMNFSMWRTDVRIFNPGDEAAVVTIVHHQKGVPNKARPSVTLTVGARGLLALDEIYDTEFQMDEANGALMITSDQPVLAWCRPYNEGEQGSFGQSVAGHATGTPLSDGVVRFYTGLGNSSSPYTGFRSNAGFFNLEDKTNMLQLTMTDSAGTVVGERDYTLKPGQMKQVNIFNYLGVSRKADDVYALLVEGNCDVASYVSVIDNMTNDPTNESGIHRLMEGGGGGGGGGGCVDIPLVADGTVVNYDASGTSEGMSFSGAIEGTYSFATSTQSRRVFVTEITGVGTVTRAEMTEHGIISNPEGYREISQILVSQTSTIPGEEDEEYMDTYEPPYNDGPYTKVCAGDTWIRSPVQELHEQDGGSSWGQTDQWQGGVIAIDEQLATPSGTFTAVHTRITQTSGEEAGRTIDTWRDPETGVDLKVEDVNNAAGETLSYRIAGFAQR